MSFIPPDMMPPDPPVVKAVALIFSLFMLLVLLAFVGFVGVEFLAEMAGHPLNFVATESPQDLLLPLDRDWAAEVKSPFELIAPKHQTQLLGPEVVVIYTARTMPVTLPDLRINNVPHPWERQYGDNTWFARLQLQTGEHRLQAGESEAEFFVYTLDSTQYSQELWCWHYPHPDTDKVDRCVDCHEMSKGANDFLAPGRSGAIGPWQGQASCFACHDEEKHEIVHRFILPLIDRNPQCIRCHPIH